LKATRCRFPLGETFSPPLPFQRFDNRGSHFPGILLFNRPVFWDWPPGSGPLIQVLKDSLFASFLFFSLGQLFFSRWQKSKFSFNSLPPSSDFTKPSPQTDKPLFLTPPLPFTPFVQICSSGEGILPFFKILLTRVFCRLSVVIGSSLFFPQVLGPFFFLSFSQS